MARDHELTERLRNGLAKIKALTKSGELQWEKQIGTAHRFARHNNNLLILGPATPMSDHSVPRYLFITPFDSPNCIEINSNDPELGSAVMDLAKTVELAGKDKPATDPFEITRDLAARLDK